MLLSKRAMCESRNSKFVKEASGLFSSLGTKTPLNKIALLGPFLF